MGRNGRLRLEAAKVRLGAGKNEALEGRQGAAGVGSVAEDVEVLARIEKEKRDVPRVDDGSLLLRANQIL